jgi:hypothetical protein
VNTERMLTHINNIAVVTFHSGAWGSVVVKALRY